MALDIEDIVLGEYLFRKVGQEREEPGKVLRPQGISDPSEKEREGRKL